MHQTLAIREGAGQRTFQQLEPSKREPGGDAVASALSVDAAGVRSRHWRLRGAKPADESRTVGLSSPTPTPTGARGGAAVTKRRPWRISAEANDAPITGAVKVTFATDSQP